MKIIETERWVPSKEDPSRSEYIGQRTGQEVFEELRQQLENMGCLPDEYFLLDQRWENGREIPEGADIFCTTDYGASEGIYLDVYLKWYEDGNPVTKGFITGKTLGESGDDLDRMFLISSAITKAFHGDGASHARYIRLGESQIPASGVFHLSLEEQKTIIDALITQHEKYVALCGTSEHAMLWMLEQNPQIRKVALCLDHDEAGIEASGQHEDTLRERGIAAAPLRSQYKDWNADLKALHGLPAEPAEEHPQLLAADPICQRIGAAVSSGVAKPEQAEQKLPILLQDYKNHLHQGRFDRAMDAMELAAAMALSSALREFRQMGKVVCRPERSNAGPQAGTAAAEAGAGAGERRNPVGTF